jgi:predicted dehydrogenase
MRDSMTASHTTDPDSPAPLTRVGVFTDDYYLGKYGQDLFIAPGTILQGVCHTAFPVAKYLAKAWRAPIYTEEPSTFLEHGEINTILMMLSLPERTKYIRQAIMAGKNVLYPPPFSINPNDYRDLSAIAMEKGVYLLPIWAMESEPSALFARQQFEEENDGNDNQIRCHWMLPPLLRRDSEHPVHISPMLEILSEGVHFCNSFLGEVQSISAAIRLPTRTTRQTIAHLILNHPRGVSIHHITQVPARDVRQLVIMDTGSVSLEIRIPHRSPNPHGETHHGLIFTDTGRKIIRYTHSSRNIPAALPLSVERLIRGSAGQGGFEEDMQCLAHLHAAFVSTRESMKVATPMTVTEEMVAWLGNL